MLTKESLLNLSPEGFRSNPEESFRLFVEVLEEVLQSKESTLKAILDNINLIETSDYFRRSLQRDYQEKASLIDFILERGLWEEFREYEERTKRVDHLQNIKLHLQGIKGTFKS